MATEDATRGRGPDNTWPSTTWSTSGGRLMVYPIVVGAGKRCFDDPGQAAALRLVDSRAAGEGVAILTYEPANGRAEGSRE